MASRSEADLGMNCSNRGFPLCLLCCSALVDTALRVGTQPLGPLGSPHAWAPWGPIQVSKWGLRLLQNHHLAAPRKTGPGSGLDSCSPCSHVSPQHIHTRTVSYILIHTLTHLSCSHACTLIYTYTLMHSQSVTRIHSHTLTCTHTCTHNTHICTYICTLTPAHTYTVNRHIQSYTYTHTYTHAYTLTHTHTQSHTHSHTHIHTYTVTDTYTCTHTSTYTHSHVCILIYTCTLVHSHIHSHTPTHTHILMCTHTLTLTYAHTHTVTDIHSHTHTLTYMYIDVYTHTDTHIHCSVSGWAAQVCVALCPPCLLPGNFAQSPAVKRDSQAFAKTGTWKQVQVGTGLALGHAAGHRIQCPMGSAPCSAPPYLPR